MVPLYLREHSRGSVDRSPYVAMFVMFVIDT